MADTFCGRHRKIDGRERQKSFVQGMKQIIWLEIQAQSHSWGHCNSFPNEINTQFQEL